MPEIEAPITDPVASVDPGPVDPFQVDEAALATLAPEQRQALEPMISNWKTKAQERIKQETETVSKKYANYGDYEKKAKALELLTNDQRFKEWYRGVTNPQEKAPPQQDLLRSIGSSPEELAQAIQEAAAGDHTRYQTLQLKMQQAAMMPYYQELQKKQVAIDTKIEVDNFFRRNPEAEDFNKPIGNSDSSPLEIYTAFYERQGLPTSQALEKALEFARSQAESYRSKSKQEALGMVQSKKESVTEGAPKTNKDSQTVIEVETSEKALKENLKAQMQGRSNVHYVTKKRFGRN